MAKIKENQSIHVHVFRDKWGQRKMVVAVVCADGSIYIYLYDDKQVDLICHEHINGMTVHHMSSGPYYYIRYIQISP